MPTVKFLTLGCKVNQYETQNMREQFSAAGFIEPGNGHACDIYVINTCTVTARADSESLNLIRRAKRENPRAKIIVTGCLVQLDKHKIKKIGDLEIVTNKDKEDILQKFKKTLHCEKGEVRRSNLTLKTRLLRRFAPRDDHSITYFKGHTRAFLKVQDGCNYFCSYCKVPLVRGRSRSRKLSQISREAEALVNNRVKEIVLCGICLGAYGKDLNPRLSLVDVISKLENIPGLLRIRLSSIEAVDVSDELINKMASSKKLCHHLHIPIQSGDNDILKKMRRRYTREDYINLINKIRKKVPQIAITTDVLVGFPGEGEGNFKNTVGLVKKVLPLRVHIFPYSQRKGTLAYDFKGEVNPETVKKRMALLSKAASGCSLQYRRQFLHKKVQVLIEGKSKAMPGFWQGLADNYINVVVKSRRKLTNQLVSVRISKLGADSCVGEQE